LAHQHLSENEKALQEFNIAEELDKPLTKFGTSIRHEICTFRGLVYFGQKDYDAAEKELDEALKSNEWAQAYSYRGMVRSMKKNFEGAIQDHNKALLLQPDFAQGYSARGRTHRYMGQADNAIADYRTAIQKGYEVARLEIGEYFVSLNRNQEATAELEKYLANPDNRQQRDLAQKLLDKANGK
jgi:tetratricopeptide (TPR) repeat protein